MTDTLTKLKQCLPSSRELQHPQLVEALLQTRDAFTTSTPWQELLAHIPAQALPISFFRTDTTRFFCGNDVAARYLSSGTTTAQRAISLFSTEGLLLYRMAAVASFASVLQYYWGEAAAEAHGVALIDYSSEDSSLATMLRWLNEFWSLPCMPSSALRAHLAQCNPKRPFFLWATSWQLLQLQRHMSPVPLPPRAIVIETGGWKKLRFRLGDNKFYRRMSSFFELETDNLCSEFGMCELAAQAWRCGVGNRFAFPVWVQTMLSDDGIHTFGRGSGRLCVYDPLRIDYPWLLCTEDLVSIAGRGLLRLLGRTPHAPLRGCAHDQRLIINTHKTSPSQPTRSAKKKW